jgi:cellulose synthase/poly-beta-1,6-N-acetylglucosamine synthase-like glycosyltransferase
MWIVESLLLIYFIYVVVYTATFSIAGHFYRAPIEHKKNTVRQFCVFIPCYRGDNVIAEVAKKALEQSYNSDYFTVVVIADSLQTETLTLLRTLPIQVIEVHFENSTKVKALNEAMNRLPEIFDYAIILDTDNVMETDFLSKMNLVLSANVRAVQGQRKPKNQNNSLAMLDGVSEAINNHIYRQGTYSLGLSSSISGSGIAVDYPLFKEKISSMNSIGGFDRELELLLLADGVKVHYHKNAVLFDEKVSQTTTFTNQRKRWISSQYFYLQKYFMTGLSALLKGNFTFFNSAVLRNIQLPRLVNIGLLSILTAGLYVINDHLTFGYEIWILLFLINSISILIAIPGEFYNLKLARAVLRLPIIFLHMLLLLFKLKGANKKFIHTPHGVNPNGTH